MPDHSRFFTRKELQCKCGCGKCEMDTGFLMALDALREVWKVPLHVTSGYRCKAYNESPRISGAPKSLHTVGRAVDIALDDDNERYAFVSLLMQLGFHGIGIMANAVHVDNRSARKVLFHYYGKEKKK